MPFVLRSGSDRLSGDPPCKVVRVNRVAHARVRGARKPAQRLDVKFGFTQVSDLQDANLSATHRLEQIVGVP